MPARDFAAVYEDHVWDVYGFLAYRLRSRSDVEDLTQQTFERALRAWERYDPSRANVATWLVAIARNQLIDHLRAAHPERRTPLESADLETLPGASDRYGLGIDPDLERALAELSEREREIVALRFGADLSGPEIAELIGLSLANVQQIISRSLRRLRTSLDAAHAAA
jgi:RNA polymerase sigma factor (sigma-70 family)